MSYCVYVTRTNEWWDSANAPISLEEWIAYVAADPDMRLDGFAEITNPQGEVLRIEEPGICVWTKWSKHGVAKGMAWFSWSDGCVIVSHPDEEGLEKMRQIARHFHAHVIGEEGEQY